MPINDWQTIETTLIPAPTPPPDTARTYSIVAPVVPAGFTERAKLYSSTTEMLDDGWLPSDVAFSAAEDMFTQTPTATAIGSIIVIRRDSAVAGAWQVDVLADDNGDYKLLVGGVEISSYTATGVALTVIRDGIVTSLVGSGYTGLGITPASAGLWHVDVDTSPDGAYQLLDGVTVISTATGAASSVGDIRDQLIANVIAGYSAAIVDADTLDIVNDTGARVTLTEVSPAGDLTLLNFSLSVTFDTAGVPFALTQTSPNTNANLTVGTAPTVIAVGIFDDLTAGYKLFKFWGVLTPSATDADNDEARRWVQSDSVTRRNFLFAQTDAIEVYDPGDTTNLAAQWVTGAYNRVNLCQHPNATEYAAAAMVGRVGGAFPGSRAWHRLALSGLLETVISADRSSQDTATMKARLMSWTERFDGPLSDLEYLYGGVPSGNFIFQVHATDHLWFTLGAVISDIMKSNEGVNLDAEGLQGVVSTVSEAIIPFVNEGVLADDYTVSHVPLADVPPGELAIGNFATTGAILVTATITPKLRELKVSVFLALV